jgi:predicted HTH domain antitoxin
VLAIRRFGVKFSRMILELPDLPITRQMAPAALRLELACALYARGLVGKVGGSELAGVDFFTFQGALGERGIEHYTLEMVEQDAAALRKLFPE